MSKAIHLDTIITSITAKKDGSLGLRVATPELSAEEKVAMIGLQNQNLETFIKPKDEMPADVLEIKPEVGSKTKSQRLRSVLFVMWKQEGESGEFSAYYNEKMESIIEWCKRKLD